MGRIAILTTAIGDATTPIGREIERCVIIITVIAVVMGVIYLIVAFCLGVDWLDVVTLCLGLMVANCPEGLIIMVAVSLFTQNSVVIAESNVLFDLQEPILTEAP